MQVGVAPALHALLLQCGRIVPFEGPMFCCIIAITKQAELLRCGVAPSTHCCTRKDILLV
jgi:hypothetical protein